MTTPSIGRYTFRNELYRAVPSGVLDTMYSTFAVLVAEDYFRAGDLQKELIVSAPSLGLMLSLLVLPLLRGTRWPLSRLSSFFFFAGGLFFLAPLLFQGSSWMWTLAMGMAAVMFSLQVPLVTQIYRYNYPEENRGRLYSVTGMVRAATAIPFGLAMGWLLKQDIGLYPVLLLCFLGAALASAGLFFRLPTPVIPPPETERTDWMHAFRLIREDKDFRLLLTCWTVMGIGTVAASSLFVDYLANPRRNTVHLTTAEVTLVVAVVPVAVRLCFMFAWGWLFDKLNIFAFRGLVSMVYAVAVILFFWSEGPHGVALLKLLSWFGATVPLPMASALVAMAFWGMGVAGGNIAWVLWVTRLAASDRVAEYQSVHNFLTGIRGCTVPFLGFWLIEQIPPVAFGLVCGGLAFVASLPAWERSWHKPRPRPSGGVSP